jgi:hypothetical protein
MTNRMGERAGMTLVEGGCGIVAVASRAFTFTFTFTITARIQSSLVHHLRKYNYTLITLRHRERLSGPARMSAQLYTRYPPTHYMVPPHGYLSPPISPKPRARIGKMASSSRDPVDQQ